MSTEPLIDASTIAALTGDTPADNLARQAAHAANEGDPTRAARLLAQACESDPSVPVLFLAFQFSFRTGDLPRARALAQRRIDLAAATADAREHARAWSNLGLTCLWQGDLSHARAAAQQAITLNQSARDPLSLSRDLALLAQVHEAEKQWTQARDLYLQALALAEQVGDPAHIATKLTNLGDVYLALHDPRSAAACWSRALPLLLQVGKLRWHAECQAKLRTIA